MLEKKKIPRAQAALDFEWKELWVMQCWIAGSVVEYDGVGRMALSKKKMVHFGCVSRLCVEKRSELPPGGKRVQRKSCL